MFNKEDDYYDAIKGAQLYTTDVKRSSNIKLTIFNVLLFTLLAYVTFDYLKSSTNIFSNSSLASLPVSKQAVLGVSETIDDSTFLIESINQNEKSYSQNELQNSMKVLMSEPIIQSKSSYTEGLVRELDDKSGFRGRIAVVNQEETLQ